jgi:N-sulfoglucosamine sulfohydrolase
MTHCQRVIRRIFQVTGLGISIIIGIPFTFGEPNRPNIVWITCEDLSPHLGCYGDDQAITPTLDKLATEGVRYTQAFANTGVCATARSCLVTGMYASSIGSQHMRCTATLPGFFKTFPQLLREAGYYTGNVSKTDYNFPVPEGAWSGLRGKAHWRNRNADQPFFYVHNINATHESRVRFSEEDFQKLTERVRPDQRRRPEEMEVPPYHPDTAKIRGEWARYYDMATQMDYEVADILEELEADGLLESTIVFFFSDHGTGLPRAKQFIFDTGMQVPLIIRFPDKWKHLAPSPAGSVTDRLVSFVDFGPSILSLAGVSIPEYIQGRAFLGDNASDPRQYVYGIRDRMDERYDMSRTVRDKHFKYHRNYMPYLPHYPWLDYMDLLETSKEMRRLGDEGKLSGAHAHFMAPTKPVEELYDIQTDPFELHNLADSPEYGETLEKMRGVHVDWVLETRDLGLIPEQYLRKRAKPTSEYEYGQSAAFPVERVLETALLMGGRNVDELILRLEDQEPAVRFWAANGLTNLGTEALPSQEKLLHILNKDTVSEVRIAAAQALCKMNKPEPALPVLASFLKDERLYIRVAAANVVDRIGEQARPIQAEILQALHRPWPEINQGANFLPWLLQHTLRKMDTAGPQLQTTHLP